MTSLNRFSRYAIYFAPARGSALARFGAAWFGWDAEEGKSVEPPSQPFLPRPIEELTAAPRRYGFHGTLKAPFRLAPGRTAAELDEDLAALAASEPAFALPPLRLAALGSFLALVPVAPTPRLDVLAARCVVELDPFRARLAPKERERRAYGLDARKVALLDRWGYPFVLDAFRFHLTLTGPLENPVRDATERALSPVLAQILASDVNFSDIALFGEPATGPFRLLRRYP